MRSPVGRRAIEAGTSGDEAESSRYAKPSIHRWFFYAPDFVLFTAGQVGRERRPLLLQDLSITHHSVANRSRDLFAVIASRELVHLIRVREKAAFYQHRRMAHGCNDKKLLRGRSTIQRLGTRDQSFLDKASQTLTFHIRRFHCCPLQ